MIGLLRNRIRRANALERDLARLADGTLDPSRRERMERLLAASPELQARLREQRRAVAAVRALARTEHAPLTLRVEHRALIARPTARRMPTLGPGLAGVASAIGAVAVTLAALTGGQAALTVAQAATIAVRPATAPVAKPPDDQVTLPRLGVGGVPFPYWEDHFGWRAAGTRTDRLDGRRLTTVFYRRGTQQVAYTIVSGGALLPAAGARIAVRAGTTLTISTTAGRRVVTWLRRGHTCVLSGRDVPLDALTVLGAWRGSGRIPY